MVKNKKMISLEITEDLREALRVEAFKRSTTISALIRQILETNLNTQKATIENKIKK